MSDIYNSFKHESTQASNTILGISMQWDILYLFLSAYRELVPTSHVDGCPSPLYKMS